MQLVRCLRVLAIDFIFQHGKEAHAHTHTAGIARLDQTIRTAGIANPATAPRTAGTAGTAVSARHRHTEWFLKQSLRTCRGKNIQQSVNRKCLFYLLLFGLKTVYRCNTKLVLSLRLLLYVHNINPNCFCLPSSSLRAATT